MTGSATRNWVVFLGVILFSLGAAAVWLSTIGAVDDNIRVTLRHSVQLAYVLLLVVLLARPLQLLLRKPWTAKLLRNRRLVGVAFAGAMTAHLALIIFRYNTVPELSFDLSGAWIGASAYALVYLMFITSFNGPAKAIGPKAWKILHRLGLLVFIGIFAVPRTLAEISEFDYLKFGLPMLIVLLIRFAAWRRSNQRDKQRSAA